MKTVSEIKKRSTSDRLAIFIGSIGVRVSEFERNIDVGNGYIGKQIKRNGSIGSHIIEKILTNYPELNVVWLMTGREKMLRKQVPVQRLKRADSELMASA